MSPEETSKIEPAEITAQQAVEYLTDPQRHTVLQVLGQYIKGAETGQFDTTQITNIISKHLLEKDPAIATEIVDFFNFSFGYQWGDQNSQQLQAELKSLPKEIKTFLYTYTRQVNKNIETRYDRVFATTKVKRVYGVLSQIAQQEELAGRPLKPHEKDQFIQGQFKAQTGRHFSGKQDISHPAYKLIAKQAEVMSIQDTKPLGEGVVLSELIRTYENLFKDLYTEFSLKIDPQYNPLRTSVQLTREGDEEVTFLVSEGNQVQTVSLYTLKEMIDEIEVTQPEFYMEATARFEFMHLINNYISDFPDPQERADSLERIKNALSTPIETLTDDQKIHVLSLEIDSHYVLSKLLIQIHHDQQAAWEIISKSVQNFGRKKTLSGYLSLFVKSLRNREVQSQIFRDFAPVSSELTTVLSQLKDMVSVAVVMTGNPLHVMRFPPEVSVFPRDQHHDPANFVEYQQFISNRDLSSKVVVKNKMLFVSLPKDPVHIYLALPQYAPIANFGLYAQSEKGRIELVVGTDFSLDYEPQTGHYRVTLLSQSAISAGKKGVEYAAGLDFIQQQKEVPQRVNTVELSTTKIERLIEIIQAAGFDRLATNLQKSLTPTAWKRVKVRLSGESFRYSSDELARAIRDSIYYSFAAPGAESAEVKMASQIVSRAVESELDLSFLPKVDTDQAKIRVQCTHVAQLYSLLFNYLFVSDQHSGGTYELSLFADPADGVTALMGFRLFTSGHADTRGNFGDGQATPQRFQQDLTPWPSLQTLVDSAKSVAGSLQQLKKNFIQLRKALDGELSGIERFYIEVTSNNKSFSEYILQLKREAADYSQQFGQRQDQLDAFVHADSGVYHSPDQLIPVMKRKPLAAVVNILLFFQEYGREGLKQKESVEQMQTVLSTIVEWFRKTRNQDQSAKLRREDRSFLQELNAAAGLAEKLILLLKNR